MSSEFTCKTMNVMRLTEYQIETAKYLVRQLYDDCPNVLIPQLEEVYQALIKMDTKISNFIHVAKEI